MFDLGEGYTLVAKLGETGVVPFAVVAPRLWNMAPLDQSRRRCCSAALAEPLAKAGPAP
jgi:hypothetical protein